MFRVDEQGVRWYAPVFVDAREPGPVPPRRQCQHERLIGYEPAEAERRESRIFDGPVPVTFAALPLGGAVAAAIRAADAHTAHACFTGRPVPTASFVPAASVVADGPQAPNGPNTEPLSSHRRDWLG